MVTQWCQSSLGNGPRASMQRALFPAHDACDPVLISVPVEASEDGRNIRVGHEFFHRNAAHDLESQGNRGRAVLSDHRGYLDRAVICDQASDESAGQHVAFFISLS